MLLDITAPHFITLSSLPRRITLKYRCMLMRALKSARKYDHAWHIFSFTANRTCASTWCMSPTSPPPTLFFPSFPIISTHCSSSDCMIWVIWFKKVRIYIQQIIFILLPLHFFCPLSLDALVSCTWCLVTKLKPCSWRWSHESDITSA